MEREGTKSRRNRDFGLPQQAADALRRLSQRENFTGPDHLVFCSPIGRRIDDAALRKRYKRAQIAAGVPELRLHDLRHSFGSLLAAGGVDLVNIQGAMGHSQIQTTMIYMHAKDAKEQADIFTKALEARLRGSSRSSILSLHWHAPSATCSVLSPTEDELWIRSPHWLRQPSADTSPFTAATRAILARPVDDLANLG